MLEKIRERLEGYGSSAQWALWMLIVGFSILPLIRTVNEFMTLIALRTGAYVLVERFVAPTMARMIGSILRYVFGVETIVNGGSVYLVTRGLPYELYISWNCVGWQSLVLLLFSLVTGLQGRHSLWSKLKCVALGLEGVVAVNLLRIVSSALLLLRWGYGPAIAFHDHLSLIITFGWLAAFWYLSNEFILEPEVDVENRTLVERIRESMRGLRFRSLLPDFIYGRRAMGLATMAIILVVTALGGVAVLSAKVPSDPDPTTLSFEYVVPAVTVNGVETNRILTHPDYTHLDPLAHPDPYTGSLIPQWVEMWSFYLYGPLEESYTLTGEVKYVVWLHLQLNPEGKTSYWTYIRFNISDVDALGNSVPVHSDTFRIKLSNKPTQHSFIGGAIPPHTFAAGHTIRLSIEIFDGFKLTYVLEYDSESRHSYIDLPGIVVSENLTSLLYLAFAVPPLVTARREEKT